MIHLVTWLPLPYQLTLCRSLHRAYGDDFVVWFAERAHRDFPYRTSSSNQFLTHYLSEEGYGELWKRLRSDPEAVVILSGWSSPMTKRTLIITSLMRIPVFIWADHPHPRARSWLVEFARKAYLRFLARRVEGFLACGIPTVEHLASLGIDEQKITNFPYWVELPQEWSVPERCLDENAVLRPLRLLGIGRQVPVKQFDVAIEAVALANQKAGRDLVELVMIGDGPERANLEARAKSLAVETAVSFPGWMEVDDVKRELREADAVILTSRFDAYGVVVLEAMAAGRPVLASKGVVAALDRDEGTGAILLHAIGDVECLAQQIALLATDCGKLREASFASRATAEKWRPERASMIIDGAIVKLQSHRSLAGRHQPAHPNSAEVTPETKATP
jgi:glycosyltransferase involved in cell wall biosynthesis